MSGRYISGVLGGILSGNLSGTTFYFSDKIFYSEMILCCSRDKILFPPTTKYFHREHTKIYFGEHNIYFPSKQNISFRDKRYFPREQSILSTDHNKILSRQSVLVFRSGVLAKGISLARARAHTHAHARTHARTRARKMYFGGGRVGGAGGWWGWWFGGFGWWGKGFWVLVNGGTGHRRQQNIVFSGDDIFIYSGGRGNDTKRGPQQPRGCEDRSVRPTGSRGFTLFPRKHFHI